MSIAVVTDSGADLPLQMAEKWGIDVVPLSVNFGRESRQDRIDIDTDEFYERLARDPIYPTTSQPSIGDFLRVFEGLLQKVSDIISIHISGKWSKSLESARQAKEIVQQKKKCQIELVDSRGIGMWQGLLAMMAARLARQGENLEEIVKRLRETIPHLHLQVILDNLEYVRRGGRLGRASVLLRPIGRIMKMKMINVKPVLTIKEGEAASAGLVRAPKKRAKLVNFVKSLSQEREITEIAIEYSTSQEEAEELRSEIIAVTGDIPLYVVKIGPVIGAHTGPGALAVVVREGNS